MARGARHGRARRWGVCAVGLTVLLAMPCVETLLPPQSPLHASAALSGAASRRRASVEDACTGRRLVSSMAAVLVAGGGAAPQERPAGFWDRVWGARHHLLAGAMGRFVAVNIMFPVDTVKTRLQMQMNGGAAMTVRASCSTPPGPAHAPCCVLRLLRERSSASRGMRTRPREADPRRHAEVPCTYPQPAAPPGCAAPGSGQHLWRGVTKIPLPVAARVPRRTRCGRT